MNLKLSSILLLLGLLNSVIASASTVFYHLSGDIRGEDGTVDVYLSWDLGARTVVDGFAYVSAFRTYAPSTLDLDHASDVNLYFTARDTSMTTTIGLSLYGIFYDYAPSDYVFDARTQLTTNSYGWPRFYVDIIERPVEISSLSQAAPVPVPAAVWLFGSGLLGLLGAARRRCL